MNCQEFEARIQRQLDRRVPLAADLPLRQHANSCPPCEATLAAYLKLFEGLERIQVPDLDDGFGQRVVQLACPPAVASAERRVWKSGFSLLAAGAVAALLLIAALPLFRDEGEVALRPPAPESSEPEAAEFVGSPFPASPRSASIAEIDAPSFSEADWLLLWERLGGEVTPETVEPLEVFAHGLRPIATSLATVWSGLRDTWPWGRDPAREASPEDAERLPGFPAA
jgi:hypothetical protein